MFSVVSGSFVITLAPSFRNKVIKLQELTNDVNNGTILPAKFLQSDPKDIENKIESTSYDISFKK